MVIRTEIREGSGHNGMRLQLYALFAPLDRIADAPGWGRVMSILAALCSYLIHDVFATALCLIVASGGVDYFLGVQGAKARRRADGSSAYDSEIARAGAISKVSGVALMMLVRMAEQWLMSQHIVNTRGMIAAALTLSLFAVDLESIQAKREEMGARPVPALGWFTNKLHTLITGGAATPRTDVEGL